MLPDYYAILEVAPEAIFAELKAAYRRKVLTCHPDRGGTHEQMVQINEAWEVLSVPDVRAAYDAARRNQHDAEAQAAAAREAESARERARHYPQSSEEMQHWLDAMRQDFAETTYDQGNFLHLNLTMPSANSRTGMQFVFAGILVGILVGEMIRTPEAPPRLTALIWGESPGPGQPRQPVSVLWWLVFVLRHLFRIGCDGFLGVIAFVSLHRGLHVLFVPMPEEPPSPAAQPEAPPPPPPPERVVIRCPSASCGQKLRVPILNHDVNVRCGKCGHRFVRPGSQDYS